MNLKLNFLTVAVLGCCFSVVAQTNAIPIVTTNWLPAAPTFREVNGQLYNTSLSVKWKNVQGSVLEISTNGLLIQTFELAQVYKTSTMEVPVRNLLREVIGYRTVPVATLVGTKTIAGARLLLRHYPARLLPQVGQQISFRAMPVGTTNDDGGALEVWDYGTPHFVMVVTTNYAQPFKTYLQ